MVSSGEKRGRPPGSKNREKPTDEAVQLARPSIPPSTPAQQDFTSPASRPAIQNSSGLVQPPRSVKRPHPLSSPLSPATKLAKFEEKLSMIAVAPEKKRRRITKSQGNGKSDQMGNTLSADVARQPVEEIAMPNEKAAGKPVDMTSTSTQTDGQPIEASTAKSADKAGKNERSDTLSSLSLEIDRAFEEYTINTDENIFHIKFSHPLIPNWTLEDDRRLQESWTQQDVDSMDSSPTSEQALWEKSMRIFGKFPGALLPEGVRIAGMEKFEDGDSPINIGNEFSQILGTILCCPIFHGKLYLLQYAILYAMHLRLRERDVDNLPMPSLDMLSSGVEDIFIGKVTNLMEMSGLFFGPVQLTVEEHQHYRVALRETFGQQTMLPPHYKFTSYLKDTIKEYIPSDDRYLLVHDLEAVVEAWDIYAKEHGMGSMKTYEEAYTRKYSSGVVGNDRMTVEGWFKVVKKGLILEKRLRFRLAGQAEERAERVWAFQQFSGQRVGAPRYSSPYSSFRQQPQL